MDLSGGNGSLWEFENKTVRHSGLKKSYKMVSLVLYGLVFVLGVSGNAVVIWATTGARMKRTVNTVWYLNLAVADFLVAASLPLGMAYVALDEHWPFGRFMCKAYRMLFYTNMYVSVYSLVAIGGDRCAVVVWPVWARNHRTVRKASWVRLGIWALALTLASPHFVFRDIRPSERDGGNVTLCYNDFALSGDGDDNGTDLVRFRYGAVAITRFLMGFVVPFAAIVACYSAVICRLKRNRSLAGQTGRPSKIVATVIGVFFLCWAPYHVLGVIKVVNGSVDDTDTLYLALGLGVPITVGLALLNSCLNPLLYVFVGQDFKDVFRRSVLKVLEKAFAEEPPQKDTLDPDDTLGVSLDAL